MKDREEEKDGVVQETEAPAAEEKAANLKEQPKADMRKTVEVDAYKIHFTESMKFMHGGEYYTKLVGDTMKVSKDLKDILVARGCVRVL